MNNKITNGKDIRKNYNRIIKTIILKLLHSFVPVRCPHSAMFFGFPVIEAVFAKLFPSDTATAANRYI